MKNTALLSICVGMFLMSALVANAADLWTVAGQPIPPSDAPLVNLGNLKLNGFGNRVAVVRINTKGFRMDILTEFDCSGRRARGLSSSLSDPGGNLVSASGATNTWYAEKDSVGLSVVCNAQMLSK